MIFSVPLGEPVYPRSRSIKRAIGLTLVFSSRVFSTSQLHLIACESSLQRSNWLTFFVEFPSMMVMPFFFFEGVSEGLFCLSPPFFFKNSFLPPPSVLLHRHRSKFFTFSGRLDEQKRDFDSFIHRVEYPKRGRKISTHHPKKRALSSLLFSSLLFSSLSKHKEEEESVASQIHARTHHARHVNHKNDEYDGFFFLFCIDRDKKDDKL